MLYFIFGNMYVIYNAHFHVSYFPSAVSGFSEFNKKSKNHNVITYERTFDHNLNVNNVKDCIERNINLAKREIPIK